MPFFSVLKLSPYRAVAFVNPGFVLFRRVELRLVFFYIARET